jgi:hypothetical protein
MGALVNVSEAAWRKCVSCRGGADRSAQPRARSPLVSTSLVLRLSAPFGGHRGQVAFYVDSNGDGVLDAGDTLLGYGTQSSSGTWTFTFSTTGWASGSYTLFAQAEDSYGALSDPVALTLQLA